MTFSNAFKSVLFNSLRYYDISQSLTFEYIRMLKELNMSMKEIKEYMGNPNEKDFMSILDAKSFEIERQIERLKQTHKLFTEKKNQLELCQKNADGKIQVISCNQQHLLVIPYDCTDNPHELYKYINQMWGIGQSRSGVGSYILADKVLQNDFSSYNGLFTYPSDTGNLIAPRTAMEDTVEKPGIGAMIKPKGEYLCAYIKGTWDKIPDKYRQMVDYAKEHDIRLMGYAYEWRMNELAIKDENDYITQIQIQIEDGVGHKTNT